MQSLRDKLLKAGLVTAEQAQKAEEAKAARPAPPTNQPRERRPVPQRREGGGPRVDAVDESRIPKLPPLPGSKEHQRILARKQRELDAELYGLVRSGEVPLEPGETAFYFVTRKGNLRRLELSAAQAKSLEEGKLAVVERQEPDRLEHSLVNPDVAEKMFALFPKSVRFLAKEGAKVGFMSEDELAKMKADEAANPSAEDEAAAKAETWVTVKRST